MTNEERYNKACDRVDCRNGGRRMSHKEIIVDLEMEIERYRDKIMHMENHIEELTARLNRMYGKMAANEITRQLKEHRAELEMVQPKTVILQCGISDIVKVLSDNDYNVSINLFKNDESED